MCTDKTGCGCGLQTNKKGVSEREHAKELGQFLKAQKELQHFYTGLKHLVKALQATRSGTSSSGAAMGSAGGQSRTAATPTGTGSRGVSGTGGPRTPASAATPGVGGSNSVGSGGQSTPGSQVPTTAPLPRGSHSTSTGDKATELREREHVNRAKLTGALESIKNCAHTNITVRENLAEASTTQLPSIISAMGKIEKELDTAIASLEEERSLLQQQRSRLEGQLDTAIASLEKERSLLQQQRSRLEGQLERTTDTFDAFSLGDANVQNASMLLQQLAAEQGSFPPGLSTPRPAPVPQPAPQR